ncbi:RRNA biogenesis protein [Actinidia chinensis var. chinensis]|uniref:rRNA biogenesis protein n=1 Tax=Actinidia chinensis var. chinensis TaxID=1590841 RepID=A0A2R6QQ09_ACTCC|nr:RRNA biogenesis protein [Actinidia chinensis var. chinensis]
MEPAKIDWATINSVFAVDDLYEHINAPKWVDFSAPDQSIDEEAWFCRPDCNHPKRVEDFLKGTPPSKKSASVSEILPLGDRNRRDANLKRRGLVQPPLSSIKDSKCKKIVEDGENQNPNFSTSPSHPYNTMKAAIKSSTEKEKKQTNNSSQQEERPHLRSTLSARNLFAGRDILSQITEFCNELKRLATREREKENAEGPSPKKEECGGEKVGEVDERRGEERERKPLLEVKSEAVEKSSGKEKQRRKKRADETENIPISLDLKSLKRKEGDGLSQIRTCPPSPQCFSAGRGSKAAVPLKASRLGPPPPERGILQELGQSNGGSRKEEPLDNNNRGRTASTVVEKEARTLDVFWFLKPCTLSS